MARCFECLEEVNLMKPGLIPVFIKNQIVKNGCCKADPDECGVEAAVIAGAFHPETQTENCESKSRQNNVNS